MDWPIAQHYHVPVRPCDLVAIPVDGGFTVAYVNEGKQCGQYINATYGDVTVDVFHSEIMLIIREHMKPETGLHVGKLFKTKDELVAKILEYVK